MIIISFVFLFFVFNHHVQAADKISEIVPQLARAAGYPIESHKVNSGGYQLMVHRLPQRRSHAPSVMILHGLFCSSIDWVFQGPGKALGYLLHDAGMDVWLPNLRGTTPSLRHKTLKPTQREFWNFTFEDMGTEDILILTDYILKQTGNKKIHFISNSMGGTSMLSGLSEKPEYNNRFHQLIMFGPHTNMNNTSGSVRTLSALEPQIQRISRSANIFQIPPNYSEGMLSLMYNICRQQDLEVNLCAGLHNLLIGNGALLDFPLFNKYVKYYPTATSVKNVLHIFQTIGKNRFARFDYGRFDNMKIYGSPHPKSYSLRKVKAPVILIHAKNDNLVPPKDIEWLKTQLPNVIETIYITRSDFGHSSFLWHPNISDICYKRIVSLIANFSSNSIN